MSDFDHYTNVCNTQSTTLNTEFLWYNGQALVECISGLVLLEGGVRVMEGFALYCLIHHWWGGVIVGLFLRCCTLICVCRGTSSWGIYVITVFVSALVFVFCICICILYCLMYWWGGGREGGLILPIRTPGHSLRTSCRYWCSQCAGGRLHFYFHFNDLQCKPCCEIVISMKVRVM